MEAADLDRMRETQRRHIVELKLKYESQLDDKERELTKLKEKIAK